MSSRYWSGILAVALLMISACVARPTEMTTTWVDPAPATTAFRKSAAIFLSPDTALRRRVEDRVAQRLPGVVASHTLIPADRLDDPERVRAELTAAGFDGAIVLHLMSVEGSGATGAATTPSEDLWTYMERTPRIALTPGRETVITMESRLYSVTDGRALWAGRSRSFNPVSVRELVNMLVDAAADEIRKQTLAF